MPSLSLPNGPITLDNLVIPGPLVGSSDALVTRSITICDGRFSDAPAEQRIDMKGQMALPALVDMHTHLDKGHIWPRKPNPDGTFDGALSSVGEDREAKWSAEDVRARMSFALEAAYAYGTKAVRTHLDSIPPQDEISWAVFDEVRADWKGKINLQAVSLVGADGIEPDGTGRYQKTADIVSNTGGVLGMVTYPLPDLAQRLEAFFKMATQRNLDADFHVDETGDPSVATLRQIAQMVLKTGYKGKVVCGHCCSLAVQDESEADRTMDLVAEAGLTIVSLPLCNLYLQDRDPGRTPRWRGVTLVHEMKARGIPVAFASDNTRDPFYAYGDLDMVEVLRGATRIAHLDHTSYDWVKAFTTTPAAMCDFAYVPFADGEPADLIVFKARSWNELLSRPQTDRTVIRDGEAITVSPPDYAVLDPLME